MLIGAPRCYVCGPFEIIQVLKSEYQACMGSTKSEYAPASLRDDGLVIASPQYDMWGFGVILYQLCSGSPLLESNYADELVDRNELQKLVRPHLRQKPWASSHAILGYTHPRTHTPARAHTRARTHAPCALLCAHADRLRVADGCDR